LGGVIWEWESVEMLALKIAMAVGIVGILITLGGVLGLYGDKDPHDPPFNIIFPVLLAIMFACVIVGMIQGILF
jgi:O-antigen/teichoic acid export membrane protein